MAEKEQGRNADGAVHSPSPLPSPQRRGRSLVSRSAKRSASELTRIVPCHSLSSGERAEVRGNSVCDRLPALDVPAAVSEQRGGWPILGISESRFASSSLFKLAGALLGRGQVFRRLGFGGVGAAQGVDVAGYLIDFFRVEHGLRSEEH